MAKTPVLVNNSGFTVFELAVVIFIAGVCVAMGIPNFLQFASKAKLNGASRQVAGDLIAARMEAIKQNCNVIVGFQDQNRYYIVVDKNSNNSYDATESKIIRDLSDHYPGVKNIKADTKNIFNSKGAMRRMRTIELQNSSNTVKIRISIAGRVKID